MDSRQRITPHVRVVKVGGSLLLRGDLHARFTQWLNRQSVALNLVVVGGGELVESVRELDRCHTLSQTSLHWMCIDLMNTTAQLAGQILDCDVLLDSPESLDCWMQQQRAAQASTAAIAIVQPSAYYTREIAEISGHPLPEDWTTTSDTLAAWLACQVAADSLVLLKSCGTSSEHALDSDAIHQLMQAGIVDAFFPNLAHRVADVRLFNLVGQCHF